MSDPRSAACTTRSKNSRIATAAPRSRNDVEHAHEVAAGGGLLASLLRRRGKSQSEPLMNLSAGQIRRPPGGRALNGVGYCRRFRRRHNLRPTRSGSGRLLALSTAPCAGDPRARRPSARRSSPLATTRRQAIARGKRPDPAVPFSSSRNSVGPSWITRDPR
jgi:hypothetical protein